MVILRNLTVRYGDGGNLASATSLVIKKTVKAITAATPITAVQSSADIIITVLARR